MHTRKKHSANRTREKLAFRRKTTNPTYLGIIIQRQHKIILTNKRALAQRSWFRGYKKMTFNLLLHFSWGRFAVGRKASTSHYPHQKFTYNSTSSAKWKHSRLLHLENTTKTLTKKQYTRTSYDVQKTFEGRNTKQKFKVQNERDSV